MICMADGCANRGTKHCSRCKTATLCPPPRPARSLPTPRLVRYCGQACQKRDWRQRHKRSCGVGWWATQPHAPLASAPLALCRTESMGLGVVASRAIAAGELLWCETPALTVPRSDDPAAVRAAVAAAFEALDPVWRARCLELYDRHAGATGGVATIEGVFETNCGEWDGALSLYPIAARLNHSCTPNVSISHYRDATQVRAARPIGQGQELFTSYTPVAAPVRRLPDRSMPPSPPFPDPPLWSRLRPGGPLC